MVIYADEVFILNMIANLLLLLCCDTLFHISARRTHVVAAAGIVALYAVFESVYNLPRILRAAVLFCMTYTSFGHRALLRNTARLLFVIVCLEAAALVCVTILGGSAVVAGGVISLFANEPITAVLYALAYPSVIAVSRLHSRAKRRCRVHVEYNNAKLDFTALYDSGNMLKYQNIPVIIVSWQSAKELVSYESYDAFVQSAVDFVLFTGISGSSTAPVIIPDKCYVNGCSRETALAVCDRNFSMGCTGLVGEI